MHGAMRAARVRSPRFTAKIMQLQICMIATDTLNACLRHLSYPPKLRNFWIATLFRSRLAEISSTYIGFSGPCPRAAALALDNGISIGEKRKNAHLHGRNSRAGDVPGSYACYGPSCAPCPTGRINTGFSRKTSKLGSNLAESIDPLHPGIGPLPPKDASRRRAEPV